MASKKVLILTTTYGNGHLYAANNLMNELKKQQPKLEVHVLDLYNEAHPNINKLIKNMYLRCYSSFPKLYDDIYDVTDKMFRKRYFKNIVGRFGYRKLREYINNFKPDVIINTFPILTTILLNKKENINIPCYIVTTDYTMHNMWVSSDVEKYFIADDDLKELLIKAGVPNEKIQITGIPARIDLQELKPKGQIIEKYNLLNKELPLVTIFLGTFGVLRGFHNILPRLYNIKPEVQYIIVCGNNKKMKDNLMEKCKDYTDRINIIGYADDLRAIMNVSDVVVTKPGGLTTTEMLNLGVPMIMYGNPPAQEYGNLKFLLKNKCCVNAKNNGDLINLLRDFLMNPQKLRRMKNNIKKIARPMGCTDIAKQIIIDLEGKPNVNKRNTKKIH